MTALTVLVAAPELAVETDLVSALTRARDVVTVRRCVDAIDLLGVASTGAASLAIIGSQLPRAGVELVERLRATGIHVVGIVDPRDGEGAHALRRWGIDEVHTVDPSRLHEFVHVVAVRPEVVSASEVASSAGGRVIAVWGPYGAPGRTTVAVGIADEMARLGASTMLVDADPHGGAAAIHLGLLDESSGLLSACRRAEQGVLDLPGLARSARSLGKGLRVLTGLDAPTMWTHVRPTSLARVLALSRVAVETTLVDVGFGLDDTGASRGSSAITLAAIASADMVLAVASADPVGISRLSSSLPTLRQVAGSRPIHVVINKVATGNRAARREISEALGVLCDVTNAVHLPYDSAAHAAVRDGATLAESAPRSALRGRVRDLAESTRHAEISLVLPDTWSAA